MHIASLSQILLWIDQYKYWVIFPLTIIEGPIVTIISAFLASEGRLNLGILFLVALSGDMIGDSMYYLFGRWFYEHILVRYENYFQRTGVLVEEAIGYLREHPGKAIIFGKWTQVAGFAILIGSGAAKVPFRRFLVYCIVWTAPKLIVLILFGYLSGSAYDRIDTYLGKISLIMLAILWGVIVHILYTKRPRKWKKSPV